jgi:hypothetical protein
VRSAAAARAERSGQGDCTPEIVQRGAQDKKS